MLVFICVIFFNKHFFSFLNKSNCDRNTTVNLKLNCSISKELIHGGNSTTNPAYILGRETFCINISYSGIGKISAGQYRYDQKT